MSSLKEHRYPGLARVWGIARLTIRSAFRYRLIAFLLPLLAGLLISLPYLIRHNGTAEMLTQVVLSYSLGLIIALLGVTTIWLACGSMAKEIQECQLQMVVVKPIARWQIWLGKWLGITTLNALLLLAGGVMIFGILYSESRKLSLEERKQLRERVLTARGSLSEPPPDLSADVDRLFQERLQRTEVADMDKNFVRQQIEDEVWAMNQIVKPQHLRRWEIDFGWRQRFVQDRPLHLRVKFYAAQASSTGNYRTLWIVGDPNRGMFWRQEFDLSPTRFHEIEIPKGLIGDDGILQVECRNYTEASLIFPAEEGLEVLFPEGNFVFNYLRALSVILLWLGLLAAFGLAASSILSFPVASFLVFALICVIFSGNLVQTIVSEGTVFAADESGQAEVSRIDRILVPLFDLLLQVIEAVQAISPVESLAAGRSIPIDQLAKVSFKLIFFLGLPAAGFGMYLFHRNELATSGKNG